MRFKWPNKNVRKVRQRLDAELKEQERQEAERLHMQEIVKWNDHYTIKPVKVGSCEDPLFSQYMMFAKVQRRAVFRNPGHVQRLYHEMHPKRNKLTMEHFDHWEYRCPEQTVMDNLRGI